METKVTSHIVKGVIISLIMIVLALLAYFTHQEQSGWARWGSNILLLAGVIWACISYGRQMNDNVTFGNVFAHGFKVSTIVTLFMVLYTVAFILLMPELKEKALVAARIEMEKNPNLTENQIDEYITKVGQYFYLIAVGGALLGTLFIGLISSLIGAGLTKKNPRSPFENQL